MPFCHRHRPNVTSPHRPHRPTVRPTTYPFFEAYSPSLLSLSLSSGLSSRSRRRPRPPHLLLCGPYVGPSPLAARKEGPRHDSGSNSLASFSERCASKRGKICFLRCKSCGRACNIHPSLPPPRTNAAANHPVSPLGRYEFAAPPFNNNRLYGTFPATPPSRSLVRASEPAAP